MESIDLEPITDENWHEAASVLCRSAMFYETMLTKSLEILLEEGKRDAVEELIDDNAEGVEVHAAVVKHWRRFLEIGDDG